MIIKTIVKAVTPIWLRQYALKIYYLRRLKGSLARTDGEHRETDVGAVRKLVGEGDAAVDIGANFGFYTALLAGLVGSRGRVYSVEPISLTYEILQNNIRKLNLGNVRSFHCAMSGRDGTATMEVPKYEAGGDNFYQARIVPASEENGSLKHFPVKLKSLDSLLQGKSRRIRFVKIDVEGHELSVIQGASRTIDRSRPVLFIEVSTDLDDPGSPASELSALLGRKGYSVFWFDGTNLRPRQPGDRSVNYFFLTEEHRRSAAQKGLLSAA